MNTKDAATSNLLICLVVLAALLALPMWTQTAGQQHANRERRSADKNCWWRPT
jgi:hypothetical protein